MNTRITLFLVSLMVLATPVLTAQMNMPLPSEIKQAYQNGTRSQSGHPGKNYWQNSAKYVIRARLLVASREISGEEKITYFNNSPDSLNRLVVRLYPDLFKKGNAKNWSLGEDAMTGGTSINYLKIDGTVQNLDDSKKAYRSATNLHIMLERSLNPGDSIQLEMGWQFDIPASRPVRTGYYGDSLFFIAYWYPQIAVYDDIDGWDTQEYLGTTEFYNDFNDYDVYLEVPGNFLVWATGSLQNEKQLFTEQVLKNLDLAKSSDEIVNILTASDCREGKVIQQVDNTWHFSTTGVSDFSFASALHVNWDGSSLLVDEQANRKVFVDAVYPDNHRTYDTAALWSRNSIRYMSFDFPGYPFPFDHMTTFSNGRDGGGMESPMMANNGDPEDPADAAATVFHEIAHAYFPFFTGINERKYAWMDEGWAAYLPAGFMEQYYPERNYFERAVGSFEKYNGKEREANLMTLSYLIGGYDSYRNHAYNKPALAFVYLNDALGDSTFKLALHTFINRWQGKHPTPYDFFNVFTDATGRPLDWFFIPWFFEKAQADLGIKKATLDNKIVVENIGGLPLPVDIQVEFDDGSSENYYEHAGVWQSGNQAIVVEVDPEKRISKVLLGSDRIPDINKMNNVMVPVYE